MFKFLRNLLSSIVCSLINNECPHEREIPNIKRNSVGLWINRLTGRFVKPPQEHCAVCGDPVSGKHIKWGWCCSHFCARSYYD